MFCPILTLNVPLGIFFGDMQSGITIQGRGIIQAMVKCFKFEQVSNKTNTSKRLYKKIWRTLQKNVINIRMGNKRSMHFISFLV